MEKIKKSPELLAPAGDMASLEAAVKYGADAVYLGGTSFSMRSAPKNFDAEQLKVAVDYCHSHGVRVYLTCNVLPRNNELAALPEFLAHAKSCGVDALIIADLGVLELAKKYAEGVELHVSTQTGVVNYATANRLFEMGARRVVLARELSLEEIRTVRDNVPKELEIECFVHGAMCVSFSGRCLLSNYLVGRDSNRGDCAQPCRWKFSLTEEKRPGQYFPIDDSDGGTFILNSKDMCMIEHIPKLVKAGISSFKIEGRAKSEYYVSVVTNAYRAAIDGYLKNPVDDYVPEKWITDELRKISYRDYCTGFYFSDPSDDAAVSLKGGYNREWDVMAVVESCENGRVTCTQRNRFFEGDTLEVLDAGIVPFTVKATDLRNADGETIEATNHPMMTFSFSSEKALRPGAILRKEREM